MTDARVVRTLASLHSTIERLAAERTVSDITVSELAAAAGINRATFYKHFDSTGDVLASLLSQRLVPLRDDFVRAVQSGEEDLFEAHMTAMRRTLDHVAEHREIYMRAVENPHDGVAPNFLADHFTEMMQVYLGKRASMQPPLPDVNLDILARVYAHGIVGALKAWLLAPEQQQTRFTDTIVALTPSWLFPGATLDASLRDWS